MTTDPNTLNWEITILPYGKRCTRGRLLGVGQGFYLINAAGRVGFEKPWIYYSADDAQHKLEYEKNHILGFAHDSWIAGCAPGSRQTSLACAWKVGENDALQRHLLHQEDWKTSNILARAFSVGRLPKAPRVPGPYSGVMRT